MADPLSGPLPRNRRIAGKTWRVAESIHRRPRHELVKVLGVTAAATGLSSKRRSASSVCRRRDRGRFQASYFGCGAPAKVKVVAERGSGRLLGAQIVGSAEGATRIDVLAAAITAG
jgi:hypothetical protein